MKKLLKAFAFAIAGLETGVKRDLNFRVHITVTIVVFILGVILRISRPEWIAVVAAIGLTFSAELLNSAIEELCDTIHPAFHPAIARVKNMSAAAVLVVAAASAIIGLIVFVPYIFYHLNSTL